MAQKELRGFVTGKELANYFNFSTRTLYEKLKPLRIFLSYNQRKRLFSPAEVELIKKNLSEVSGSK
jgi:transcriptional antiterminator